MKKEMPNLLWVMRKFPGAALVLIHVLVLSKCIPMMGTKILVSIASEDAVRRHSKEEWERMKELMKAYINFCEQRKIQVKAMVTQSKEVSLGLQHLVQKFQIKRLVLGSRFMLKQEILLSCCQLWLVCNGKHISTSGAALIPCKTNPEQDEAQQYWSALSILWDSKDGLQFVTPPNDLEDEIVDDVEKARPTTPGPSGSSTKDAMNAELLKQQLDARVLVLNKIRHPNVVILHGFCSDTSALVYEYLPNGNLDERLSGKKTPQLSCWDRFRIIREQHSVLLFLHSSQPHAIVHADLKLQNILLDANNVSRLGDFGTARLILRGGSEDESVHWRTNPMGTLGYMDPIFLTDGMLTPQSDIYSFGIIILRLLTGLPALRIRERVEERLRTGTVRQLLDESAGQWPLGQTKKLMQLASRCSSFERTSRPSLLSEEWRILETLRAVAGTQSKSSKWGKSI